MEDTQTRRDVERLRESLGELPEPTINPAFIVVSGLPGSGKSYLCCQLAKRLLSLSPRPIASSSTSADPSFTNFPILESDAMRRSLFATPNYSRAESDRLFQACYMLIEELLGKGIPLILDSTNLIERHREHLYHIAERAGARLILVRVEAPPELVRERLKDRLLSLDPNDKSEADWSVYQRMSTASERIRRNHFAVDTSRDITPVIDKIVREVNR
jgi:predicted kinase